jgi:hypothetical protein
MRGDIDNLDEQIDRLRNGGTLTENEVKILCDKVSSTCMIFWSGLLGHMVDWVFKKSTR